MIRGVLKLAAAMADMAKACKDLYNVLSKMTIATHPDPRCHKEHNMKPRAGYTRSAYWHRTRSNPYSRKRHRQQVTAPKQGK